MSCSFDSFYYIFFNNLYFIFKEFDYSNEDLYLDEFNKTLFEYIMKYSKYIHNLNFNNNINFYDNYINDNNLINFLLIQQDEINTELSILTSYRPFNNIKLFSIKYNRYIKCNGFCKFKDVIKETLYSPPYLEITKNNLNNKFNNSFDILINEIYESKTKICDGINCINDGNILQNIKF